jgi:hypothetical protein
MASPPHPIYEAAQRAITGTQTLRFVSAFGVICMSVKPLAATVRYLGNAIYLDKCTYLGSCRLRRLVLQAYYRLRAADTSMYTSTSRICDLCETTGDTHSTEYLQGVGRPARSDQGHASPHPLPASILPST